ncbi:MAG TPA: ABC transporter permease [Bryobacteraceae bacterium]|jgi:putative ABC transport system permease protein|nr:ABC transporter permease [Bryobacteraceae bacterium]
METLLNDVRYALRDLRNARGFAVVAMATLALGIGAPTAMFTVINALLLRPLPFRAPDRLVALGESDTRRGNAEIPNGSLSYPDFADIQARNRSFQSVAAYRDNDYTATGFGEPRHVQVENVTAGTFGLLGVQPVLGRGFRPEEDQPGHHVVILSDTFWRAHFNADPGAIGRSIDLAGRSFTVIGVMPHGFQFPIRAEARDMWETFSRDAEGDSPMTTERGNHSLEAIARLRPGVTLAQVNADMASIAHALASAFPNSNTYTGIGARSELERLVGNTRPSLFTLFGAVGLVLLIACANVANLLLSRATKRSREIAVRCALGATRIRVVGQLITESVVLSVIGGLLGIGVASELLGAILKLYPANLPRAQEIGIDFRVILFAAALAILTGILFGLAPALRVSSPDLTNTMRDGNRSTTAGSSQNRLRASLVVMEIALGVVLLIGAGLFIRSLDRLSHVPLGFNSRHVLTASFDLSETRYNSDQQDRFVRELMDRIRIVPGVVSAAGALPLPLNDDGWSVSFNLLDHPVSAANEPSAGFYVVAPGFFETMQIPLVKGRTFGVRDGRNAPPVMIITDAFAKKYFANEDPIGKRVKIGAGEGPSRANYKTREIVGVVGDIRTGNLKKTPPPAYYIPLPQLMWGPPVLAIRTAGDPTTLTPALHKLLSSMDPDAPLYNVRLMEDYLALDLGRARFETVILGFFAGIALVLTAIGVYGVIAYNVSLRTHEIGLRVALGASRAQVLRMVLERALTLAVAGIGAGLVAALALAHVIQSLLYETPPRDPLTYVVVCVVLAAVALLASYIPALRAARMNPIVALRYE